MTELAPVWARLVGQGRLAHELAEIVAEPSRMTHAWLFLGPAGSGRSTAARCFAAALQCPRGGCDDCPVCHQVFTGNHPDVVVWSTEGLSLGVDDARELVRDSSRAVSGSAWRVILIEDADRLTQNAGNALLKAIEEPPARTVWMLCAPSESAEALDGGVMPTIRSRCRIMTLGVPSPQSIAELLERSGIDSTTSQWAAAASQGHIGRARRLATDEEARTRRSAVLGLPRRLTSVAEAMRAAAELVALATEDAAAVSATRDAQETEELREIVGTGRGAAGLMKELADTQKSRATRLKRDTLDLALVDLAAFYRDVMVTQLRTEVPMVHPDLLRDITAIAASSTVSDSVSAIEAVLSCREALSTNVAPQLAVEELLVRIAAVA